LKETSRQEDPDLLKRRVESILGKSQAKSGLKKNTTISRSITLKANEKGGERDRVLPDVKGAVKFGMTCGPGFLRLDEELSHRERKRSPYDTRLKESILRQKQRTVLARHADQRRQFQFTTMATSGAKQVHGGLLKEHSNGTTHKEGSTWLEGNDSLFQPIHLADGLDSASNIQK